MKSKNTDIQNFEYIKQHFTFEMEKDWEIKLLYLNKRQIHLIYKIVYGMTEEYGSRFIKKWYVKFQLERISMAFLKCYNEAIRFKKQSLLLEEYMKLKQKMSDNKNEKDNPDNKQIEEIMKQREQNYYEFLKSQAQKEITEQDIRKAMMYMGENIPCRDFERSCGTHIGCSTCPYNHFRETVVATFAKFLSLSE